MLKEWETLEQQSFKNCPQVDHQSLALNYGLSSVSSSCSCIVWDFNPQLWPWLSSSTIFEYLLSTYCHLLATNAKPFAVTTFWTNRVKFDNFPWHTWKSLTADWCSAAQWLKIIDHSCRCFSPSLCCRWQSRQSWQRGCSQALGRCESAYCHEELEIRRNS